MVTEFPCLVEQYIQIFTPSDLHH